MKAIRKTNLFNEYANPADTMPDVKRKSLFLPFSNYSESMTGNHLSVDAKLYPSAFICFYIPIYDVGVYSKPKDVNYFIKKMTRLYENKMAFLRDAAVSGEFSGLNLNSVEPLPYLLHYIQKNEPSCQIVYVGDIAEQDWDGVYSDMMLTIEAGMSPRKYELACVDSSPNIGAWSGKKTVDYNFYKSNKSNYLYGWYYINKNNINVFTGPEVYKSVTPGLDIGGPDGTSSGKNQYIYNVSEYFTGINCKYDSNPSSTLKFNFVVPLYDVFIDDTSSGNSGTQAAHYIDDTVPTATSGDIETINFSNIKDKKKFNRSLYDTLVPYGIWWSGYTPVTLDRSNGENPQWTLTLSQQFKPFPYSWNKLDANDTRSNLQFGTDKEYTTPIHDTFAQILSRQNNVIDKIMEQNKIISELRSEIDSLKSIINKTK